MKFLEDKGYKCWKTDVDDWSTTKHFQRRVDRDKELFSSPRLGDVLIEASTQFGIEKKEN